MIGKMKKGSLRQLLDRINMIAGFVLKKKDAQITALCSDFGNGCIRWLLNQFIVFQLSMKFGSERNSLRIMPSCAVLGF